MEITLVHIAILLLTGIAAGFASGLLGVGGGFIMIPVQFWLLKAAGVDPTLSIRIALGTNLMVVFPTALSGAISHHKRGAVLLKEGIILGVTGLAGAYLGAITASHLPEKIMTLILGGFIIFVGIRMLTSKSLKTHERSAKDIKMCAIWGLPLGILCGVMGVAGGGVMVPLMVIALKFTIHQAVATSMLVMVFNSAGGAFSFLVNGLGIEGLPPYSTGYVNWLQWVLLAGCSIPMAIVGAKAAHRLPAERIKKLFVIAMFYIGLKMTGAFAWLNLPL